jgi:hypothetical protein
LLEILPHTSLDKKGEYFAEKKKSEYEEDHLRSRHESVVSRRNGNGIVDVMNAKMTRDMNPVSESKTIF